jgi:hypothetical protein
MESMACLDGEHGLDVLRRAGAWPHRPGGGADLPRLCEARGCLLQAAPGPSERCRRSSVDDGRVLKALLGRGRGNRCAGAWRLRSKRGGGRDKEQRLGWAASGRLHAARHLGRSPCTRCAAAAAAARPLTQSKWSTTAPGGTKTAGVAAT